MKEYKTRIGVIIQRSDIDKIKNTIKSSDSKSYQDMFRLIINPEAAYRAMLIPGTKLLYFLAGLSGKIGILSLVIGIILIFFNYWYLSFALFLSWWFIWVKLQKNINYEIGSRLFAVDQALANQDIEDTESNPT